MDRIARIAPSARLEQQIEDLLTNGLGDKSEHLAKLGRLGARLVLQRAVDEEVAAFHVLDSVWAQTSSSLGVPVRYADDLVVLCTSRAHAEEAQRRVGEILAQLGLQLHPDKTRIVCLIHGRQGFDFLGFHHHKVESWRWRGHCYLNRWPSDRAMNAIRAKVRQVTGRDKMDHSVDSVVVMLNLILRGWKAYFRSGTSSRKFTIIDHYVHERLAIFDSAKHGRTKRNWQRHDKAWLERLGVYRLGRVATPAVNVHA